MATVRAKSAYIILYVLGLSLLLGLSLWQYTRGLEKQEIVAMARLVSEAPVSVAPDDWSEYVYRDSKLEGQWADPRSFILENRIHKQRVGFEVLTPFRLSGDGTWMLVNRGWVASREEAEKPAVSGPVMLSGVLYLPEIGVAFGDAVLPDTLNSEYWPKKSLYIDMSVFSAVLELDLAPAILVLNERDPSAFVQIWKAAVMTSAKHFGYAIQWLGLAITFIIYGVIWFRRRTKNH